MALYTPDKLLNMLLCRLSKVSLLKVSQVKNEWAQVCSLLEKQIKLTTKKVLIGKRKKREASKCSFCWKRANGQPGPVVHPYSARHSTLRRSLWAPDGADAQVTDTSSVWDLDAD